MFKNYFITALRNFKTSAVYSFINVIGLAVGVACFILLSLFILDEIGYDSYHVNADNIYRVFVHSKINGEVNNNSKSSAPMGEALKNDYPEIIDYARIGYFGQHNLRYQDKLFREGDIYTTDPSYFRMFTVPFIYGDPKTALSKPNSVVITQKAAKKYFGNSNPLGKSFIVDEKDSYLITGVIKDYPQKSHFRCNFLLSMVTYPSAKGNNWLDLSYETYILVKEGTDQNALEEKIQNTVLKSVAPQAASILGFSFEDFKRSGNEYNYRLQPIKSIHLYSKVKYDIDLNTEWGNNNISSITYSYILLAIGIFILLIAAINFMNLSTARSEKRAKEVGIRKTLGSDKLTLIKQFLTESVLTTFISLVFSIILIQFTLPYFNLLVERQLSLNLFDNIFTIPSLILFTLFVGMLAGFYPAFYLSSFEPVQILKQNLTKRGPKFSLRSIMVIVQFAISISLIIGTIIIKQQLDYVQNRDMGFNKEHLVVINNAASLGKKLEAFRNELIKDNNIITSTASSLMFQRGIPGSAYLYNKTSGTDVVTSQRLDVDNDFASTYQIKMKEGRFFSKGSKADSNSVVLNEAALKAFKAKSPIGSFVSMMNANVKGVNEFNIIGVVENFNYESMHKEIRPLVFHLSPVRQASTFMAIRVKSNNINRTINYIESKWKEFVQSSKCNISFLDENIARMYTTESKIGIITTAFSALAIFIACLGLFGLSAFVTERRVKEIGIRKVLGASVMEIVLLLSKEFLKWVVIANAIAFPIAYYLMNNWLQNFAFRISIGWFVFASSAIIALLIAIATVSFQAIKAAVTNPVNSLKYE